MIRTTPPRQATIVAAVFVACQLLATTGMAQPSAASPPPEPPSASPADASQPVSGAAEGQAPVVPSTPASPPGDAGDSGSVAAPTASASENRQLIEELRAELDEMKEKAEEAELAALMADDGSDAAEDEEILRLYGFADFGAQRIWVDRRSLVARFVEANALSFVTGNVNLYLDAKPAESWRTLIEVRFTNAPHGLVENYGGIAGVFKRVDTGQFDPHGSGFNVPMWRGSIVLERAWTEWQPYQFLNVRVGNFFTPWGIWNIDHGSPTLITLQLPQMILQRVIPIRQTGIQLWGSTFVDDWQLGYHLTLSNGRVVDNLFDHDDDKAFGARAFARLEMGNFNFAAGASFYAGNQENEEVAIRSLAPLEVDEASTWAYDEVLFGLDLALDYDDFRIRSEFTVASLQYEPGKHEPLQALGVPLGSLTPSDNHYYAYLILAQRLGFWGLEPLAFLDAQHLETPVGDTLITAAVGLNIHFTPSTLLKLNYAQSMPFKLSNDELATSLDILETRQIMGRVVTSF